jgi:uncharacterized protein
VSLLLIAAVAAVFAGALFQRLSGIGFSLVAAPALALISGPRSGVTLTNLLAGHLAAPRIDGARARRAAIIIAGLAALVTVAKGLLS